MCRFSKNSLCLACRRRHTRFDCDWSSDVCSSDLMVYGRGILHLSVLIETMRREGYELQLGQPQVIIKEIDGKKCEPIEVLTVDVPEESSSRSEERRVGKEVRYRGLPDR